LARSEMALTNSEKPRLRGRGSGGTRLAWGSVGRGEAQLRPNPVSDARWKSGGAAGGES